MILVQKLSTPLLQEEYDRRLECIRSVFYNFLPSVDEKWQGKAIFSMQEVNYFPLPSGKMPSYDIVVPEFPLYVVVGNISSADWPTAKLYGISRADWESTQADLAFLEKATKELATIGQATKPIVLVIRWNDPVTTLILAEMIGEATK